MTQCILCDCSPLWDDDLYGRACDLLSDDRRRKAASYMFRRDGIQSVTAGLFIRLVENTCGRVTVDGRGKPHADGMEFNISHSGRYVAFACSESPVGVDIEAVGRNTDIAGMVMVPSEYDDFMRIVKEEDREDVFCRMWTAKESYMKCLGLGLGLPPESFRVLFGYNIRCPDDTFSIRELDPPAGYHLSVCTSDGEVDLRKVTVRSLLHQITRCEPIF